jgi:hypothetical protein
LHIKVLKRDRQHHDHPDLTIPTRNFSYTSDLQDFHVAVHFLLMVDVGASFAIHPRIFSQVHG